MKASESGSAMPRAGAAVATDMRRFLEKELHGDIEDLRDLEQPARADAVHALLVFLHLLKRQAHALAETLLAHAKQHST